MIGGHILTFLLALIAATELGSTEDIQVFPLDCSHNEFSNCTRITDALKQLSSNTTLYLLPGWEHVLEEFTLVEGVKNIALIGTHQLDISLTCSKGVGLAFVGVINLTIQHIRVNQCGLSGHNLERAIFAVDEKVGTFFKVPLSLDIALLLADITDACIKEVTVHNTTGIGLLGINLIGSSALINATFSHNDYEECVVPRLLYEILGSDYEKQIGGGAFLVYYDYKDINVENNDIQMKVQNSTFLQNKDCSISGSIAQRMQFSTVLRSRGYIVGGGGGLSMVLTQKCYSTRINVNSCSFIGNAGQYGAGSFLAYFSGCISSVVFSDNQFIGNGKSELTNGGGLAILGDLIRPFGNFSNFDTESTPTAITIDVIRSVFVENSGFLGGGVFTRFVSGSLDKFLSNSNTTTLSFCNCSFQSNVAEFGAALYIHEYNVVSAAVYSVPIGSLVEVSNIHAESNTLLHPIRRNSNSSGIIDIRYVHFTLRGNCTLSHNNGTAIRAKRSPVHVLNHATFDRNVGTFGGAMALIAYSYLIIHPNTSILFTNNQATVNGGVFYVDVQDDPEYVLFDCFLYLNSSDAFYCFDSKTCSTSNITGLGISVTFLNNSAPLGSIIYGSALQSCPWGNVLRMGDLNDTLNFWLYLARNERTDSMFHFDREPSGITAVTTPSHNLRIERKKHFSRSVMPGQKFEIEMTARDRLNQQVPIAVTSTVVSVEQPEGYFNMNHHMASSLLGYSNYWGLASNNTTNVTMRIMGKINDSVTASIFTTDSAVEANVQVYLLDCYPGFMIDPHENSSCVCIPELSSAGIKCFDDDHELRIPHSIWVGPLSETDNHSLVVQRCILSYCQPGIKVITVQSRRSFDEECANGYNRTGLLCGSCREGNSVVLGTRKCKVCSNNAFLTLIIVFAVAGLLLVALVAFLKVSLSEGYLNGILFHSHVTSLYVFDLAPKASTIFLPVAFLSLDFGIETCFYSGMTALQYTGLQFVFPFYLYFLMGTITVLGRFVKYPYNVGFSAGKTFATLLVVSYISILRTCITILGHVTIQSITRPEDGGSVRWYVDPTVHYCDGWHVVLVCISLFLMISYIIPLPLLLLFPSKAYQFKYTRRMKPILDAFFAPYKPKFRCWLGVRLLFGICILAISLFLQYSRTAFMLIILALTVFLYLQLVVRPYDGICQNASDSFLLVNNIILLLGIVFYNEQYSEYDPDKTLYMHTIYSSVVVATAYVVYIAVLLYHVYLLKFQNKQKTMPCFKHVEKAFSSCFENRNGLTMSSSEEDLNVSAYYPFEESPKKCESLGVTSSTVERPLEAQDD